MIIQYNTRIFLTSPYAELPGVQTFLKLGKMFSFGLAPTDRTGTIKWPIPTKLISPMPTYRALDKTYAEIAEERGVELMKLAEKLDTEVNVLWSGGIDSTLVLVSLLKNATEEQKKRIVVLMTEESIAEYPWFYKEHIQGKLRRASSMNYPYLLGTPVILTNGEQNDQLFGFDAINRFMFRFGSASILEPRKREMLFTFFNESVLDDAVTNHFLDLFEETVKKAPVPISTHFDYLWWINFSQKWQNAGLRSLSSTARRNTALITPEYMDTYYISFYGTDNFQLWSMSNRDKRIKDEWKTYKWPAKEAIYDYTKDAEYRDNKTKLGSLQNVLMQQETFNFIDDSYRFFDDLDPSECFDPKNDFAA